jgi:hypothetical protein
MTMLALVRSSVWAAGAPVLGALISLGVSLPALAGGSSFQDNIAAYKSESRPVESAPFNSGFVTNLAISQAKLLTGRGMSSAGQTTRGGVTSVVKEGAVGLDGVLASNGGLNIASPVITGTVRGNVTVVVQKGAIKGNITAIAPN